MTTFAGRAISGYIDGSLSAARFNGPFALTFNTDESILYVADSANHNVRTISSSIGAFMYNNISYLFFLAWMTWLTSSWCCLLVTTLAGNYLINQGSADGVKTQAMFYNPYGMAFYSVTNLLYVAESYKGKIRAITSTGNV